MSDDYKDIINLPHHVSSKRPQMPMQTLPIAIYSMTRKKVSPEINALSAVIFCVILAIILISNAADSRAYRRNQKAIRKAMLDEGGR